MESAGWSSTREKKISLLVERQDIGQKQVGSQKKKKDQKASGRQPNVQKLAGSESLKQAGR